MKYKEIDIDEGLDITSLVRMEKFLHRNYPVSRIKNKDTNRFQRGIIINDAFNNRGRKYYLTPYNATKDLFTALYVILDNVYGFDPKEMTHTIYKYLYL